MTFENKKVLVTGGLGFLGSHLVDRLLQLGAKVTIIDVVSGNGLKRVEHVKDKVTVLDMDISDESKFSTLEPSDYVFHLAAYAVPNLCEKNPDTAFKSNVMGTYNILKYAVGCNAKKVVFPSSALLYGKHPKYVPIDESHPIELNTVYNVTKKLGEDMCKFFIDNFKLPVVYFRLFNSFGPRQDADYFMPTVILQALNGGNIEIWNANPTRDFTFVTDTVEAFIKAAESEFVGGPLNIGSSREVKVGDIASLIAKKSGASLTILNKEVSGPMRLMCNNEKARKLIRWEPKVGFEDALNTTIDWFEKNKSLFR